MLSDEDKKRIKNEEIFRAEIRQSLVPMTSLRGRVWGFINSAFALWLLSTIAVSGGTALYAHFANKYAEQKVIEKSIQELDLEIEGRLSQFLVKIETITEKNSDKKTFKLRRNHSFKDILKNWEILKQPPSKGQSFLNAVFPHYEGTGLISLIVQLRDKVKEEEKESLRAVIVTITGNLVFWNAEDGTYLYEGQENPAQFRLFWKLLRTKILLERWQGRFPYTDCADNPFC